VWIRTQSNQHAVYRAADFLFGNQLIGTERLPQGHNSIGHREGNADSSQIHAAIFHQMLDLPQSHEILRRKEALVTARPTRRDQAVTLVLAERIHVHTQ
jgi:hypothetical protein